VTRVAFDVRVLCRHRTGVGRYAENLIAAIARHFDLSESIGVANATPRLSTSWGLKEVTSSGVLPQPLWEQVVLPTVLRRTKAAVYHIPHEGGPRTQFGGRFVATLFDVIPLRFPALYLRNWAHASYYRFKLRTIQRRADVVITCSTCSLEDLSDLLGIGHDRLCLIPTPADPSFRPMPTEAALRTLAHLNVPREFLLSPGSAEPRKNLRTVLSAFRLYRSRSRRPLPLVLVGKDWRQTSAHALVRATGLGSHVKVLGQVSEAELVACYSVATAFIYASQFEGYGLPVLEAMACACPVITTTASSLPEVAGGAARLFEPFDDDDLATAMCELTESDGDRARLKQLGLHRVALLDWDRAAKQTWAVLNGRTE
jgi:glycosyltransferase involved in cell wall biosynthesis